MSDFYIGASSNTIDFDDAFEPYSKVKLYKSDGTLYTAGDDSGRTLTITSPYATQEMCNDMLGQVNQMTYQPFETTGTVYDPSMDLGDTLTVYGKYSAAYSLTESYGSLATASISAPNGEQIDHEIPYQSPMARAIGSLEKAQEATNRKILEDYNELVASITKQDGALQDVVAGLVNYVRYDLEDGKAFAGSALAAKIGEEAQAKVKVYVDSELGSLINIEADLVEIAGKRTEINSLTFVGGSLNVDGNISTPLENGSIQALNGTIIGKTVAASKHFVIDGIEYIPQEITSTKGTKYTVLGYA